MGEEYQCTKRRSGNGSPMTILVLPLLRLGEEYALAPMMSASVPSRSGLVWSRTFNCGLTCKWLSCRVPLNANIKGIKVSVELAGCEAEELWSMASAEDNGWVGIRHVRGASLWM